MDVFNLLCCLTPKETARLYPILAPSTFLTSVALWINQDLDGPLPICNLLDTIMNQPTASSSSLPSFTLSSSSTRIPMPSSSSPSSFSSTTRRTTLILTTIHSTSTAFSTSKVIVTIGQGITSSSDVVIATPVIIQVPTVIQVDESPATPLPDSPPSPPDANPGDDAPDATGGDSRGLADRTGPNAVMAPGTKIAAALAVGALALLAVVLGTVMLRRLGARERKRRRGSTSLGSSSSSSSSSFQPPGAYPGRQRVSSSSSERPAIAFGSGDGKGVASGLVSRTPTGSTLIPLQPLAVPSSPVMNGGTHFVHRPMIASPVGVPVQALPPPSPLLLATTTTYQLGGPQGHRHVSRPIVGLSAANAAAVSSSRWTDRGSLVEWELPSEEASGATRSSNSKRVRWQDGVQPGKDY